MRLHNKNAVWSVDGTEIVFWAKRRIARQMIDSGKARMVESGVLRYIERIRDEPDIAKKAGLGYRLSLYGRAK